MSTGWQGEPDDFSLEFDEELEDQWLAEWDEAEREAVQVLCTALGAYRGQPPPSDQLSRLAATVRTGLREGGHPLGWVQQAAGLSDDSASKDDAELLTSLAAATISPREETGLDPEEESFLFSLELADWLGAIVSVVRHGPGADASPESLVDGIRNCPELEPESDLDVDDVHHLKSAFSIVSLPWHVLGLIDADEHLTELGQWVLPRALARAWGGDFDREPGQDHG